MKVTIDIDTGGTFTDGVFSLDGRAHGIKVLTTPHDLTVGMIECIEAGAEMLSLTTERLLEETESIRFSSTIVTNALIERKGAAVGLIVSPGITSAKIRDDLVGAGFVHADLVAELEQPLDDDQVVQTVERLLDGGARVLACSLEGSDIDSTSERRVRDIVAHLFPSYLLGSIRVFIASDLSVLPDQSARTGTVALNAFVHDRLARSMYRAEEILRRRGLRRPLLLVDGRGGLARTAKTLALHAFNSGPVAGLRGAAGTVKDPVSGAVVTLDIGGTSADVSVLRPEGPRIRWSAVLGDVKVHIPNVAITPVPMGGGTIATAEEGTLRLGPESAGAHPGPACFGRGGSLPTVTDANLVLGYLDPAGFHQGRLVLDLALATDALATLETGTEGLGPAGVARLVRDQANATIANAVAKELLNQDSDPVEAVIVAYGGGGPLHAAQIAQMVGIERVIVPHMAAVLSAFGVGQLDVTHSYPYRLRGPIDVAVLEGLVETARRDMASEAVGTPGVVTRVEVVDLYSEEPLCAWEFSGWPIGADLERVGASIADEASTDALLVVTVSSDTALPSFAASPDAVAADRQQTVDWGDGPVNTPVTSAGQLTMGVPVEGPALVTTGDSTAAVPPGWKAVRRADSSLLLEAEA